MNQKPDNQKRIVNYPLKIEITDEELQSLGIPVVNDSDIPENAVLSNGMTQTEFSNYFVNEINDLMSKFTDVSGDSRTRLIVDKVIRTIQVQSSMMFVDLYEKEMEIATELMNKNK